jgi:hypothetical protein
MGSIPHHIGDGLHRLVFWGRGISHDQSPGLTAIRYSLKP